IPDRSRKLRRALAAQARRCRAWRFRLRRNAVFSRRKRAAAAPGDFGSAETPCSRGASAPLPHVDMNAAPRRSVGGGGDRNRTDDLLLAKQALSQLSYTPSVLSDAQNPRWRQRRPCAAGATQTLSAKPQAGALTEPYLALRRSRGASAPLSRPAISASPKRSAARDDDASHHRAVVGQGGFEPPTSRLSSARSNQLSY